MKRWFVLFTAGCIPVSAYRLGIENISEQLVQDIKQTKAKIGLVTNQTGHDQHGKRTIDILLQKNIHLTAIYVPEHGLDGTILAEKEVTNQIDKATNIPVISLYGNGTGRTINRSFFDQIDLIMFDIQDVGMRHYTYISTLYKVLEAAARYHKSIIVLDRPNPLGHLMEGPLCTASLTSFIGIAELPLRHGMTMGELAHYFNKHVLKKPADLMVIPLANFDRPMTLVTLHAPLSPNIQSISSLYGYSFLGLLGEIRPFDVGIGTQQAFQMITLPVDQQPAAHAWQALRNELQQFGIKSNMHTYYNGLKKRSCTGLALQFQDINNIHAFKLFLRILAWTKEHDVHITFSDLFDKAVGTAKVKDWYAGTITETELLQKIKSELNTFLKRYEDVLLYKKYPKIVHKQLLQQLMKHSGTWLYA